MWTIWGHPALSGYESCAVIGCDVRQQKLGDISCECEHYNVCRKSIVFGLQVKLKVCGILKAEGREKHDIQQTRTFA